MKALLASIAIAFTIFSLPAAAQNFPELTGRVVDQADLLDPAQEADLTTRLADVEAQSNRQFVVATVNSLEGYDIADYGYQLGRAWAIGQDGDGETEKDNGIILLVAPNERKVRIEVGYGLEGIMTDALSSIIIQNDILPRFRDGNMPAGIIAGVDRISVQLALPEEEARLLAQQAGQRSNSGDRENVGLMVFWAFVLIFFVIIPMFSNRKGKRYRRGAGPVVIWGGGGSGWGSSGSSGSSWGGGGGFGGGGFSGGGGSFGGGGASGGW
ncbi:TPM domain-containing protein [Parasphingorhabdus sp.]|uniref:TPM domain-containing protein n=2 Tax=Parasphingorhabdus sp. TaxID=2709688 RepID=UPI003266A372